MIQAGSKIKKNESHMNESSLDNILTSSIADSGIYLTTAVDNENTIPVMCISP